MTKALCARLDEGEDTFNEEIVNALVYRRDEVATSKLISILNSPNAKWRELAASALAAHVGGTVQAALLNALNDSDPAVRREAIAALEYHNVPEVTYALCQCYFDRVPEVRTAVVRALMARNVIEATDTLRKAIEDPVEEVRRAAIRSLSMHDTSAVTDTLIRAASNSDADVRAEAVRLLAHRHEEAIRIVIRAALSDDSPSVREAAVEAMDRDVDPGTMIALVDLLADDHFERFSLRRRKRLAALELDEYDTTTSLADRPVALASAVILAKQRTKETIETLIESMHHEDPLVTESLVWILGTIPGRLVTDAIVRCLADTRRCLADTRRLESWRADSFRDRKPVPFSNHPVSTAARRVLKRRPLAEVAESISAALECPGSIRIKLLGELVWLKHDTITRAILKCAKDADPDVRRVALSALASQESDLVSDALVAALDDPDGTVCTAAVRSLFVGGFPEASNVIPDRILQRIADGGTFSFHRAVLMIDQTIRDGHPELLDGRIIGPFLLMSWGEGSGELSSAAYSALQVSPVAWFTLLLPNGLPKQSYCVSADASYLLGRCGQINATPWLAGTVIRDVGDVQLSALRALGRVGDPLGLPAILNVLRERHTAEYASAATSAVKLTGPAVKPSLLLLMETRGTPDRVLATVITAIGTSGPLSPRIAADLFANLDHPSRDVRTAAATALRDGVDIIQGGIHPASLRSFQAREFLRLLNAFMEGQPIKYGFHTFYEYLQSVGNTSLRRDPNSEVEFAATEMPFGDHLRDLNKRIYLSFVIFFLSAAVGALFCRSLIQIAADRVFGVRPDSLLTYLAIEPYYLTQIVVLNCIAWLGIPFLIWQLWLFVRAGLYNYERKLALPAVVVGVVVGILAFPLSAAALSWILHTFPMPSEYAFIWTTTRLATAIPLAAAIVLGFRQVWLWLSLKVSASNVLEMVICTREAMVASEYVRWKSIRRGAVVLTVAIILPIVLFPSFVILAVILGIVVQALVLSFLLTRLETVPSGVLDAARSRMSPAVDFLCPFSTLWCVIGIAFPFCLLMQFVVPDAVNQWLRWLWLGHVNVNLHGDTWWTALTNSAWLAVLGGGICTAFGELIQAVWHRRDTERPIGESRKQIGPCAIVLAGLIVHAMLSHYLWGGLSSRGSSPAISESMLLFLHCHFTLTFTFVPFGVLWYLLFSAAFERFKPIRLWHVIVIATCMAWLPTVILGGVIAGISLTSIGLVGLLLLQLRANQEPANVRNTFRAVFKIPGTLALIGVVINQRLAASDHGDSTTLGDLYTSNYQMGCNALEIGDQELSRVYFNAAKDHVLSALEQLENHADDRAVDDVSSAMRLCQQASEASIVLRDLDLARKLSDKRRQYAEDVLHKNPSDKYAAWHLTHSYFCLSMIGRAFGDYVLACEQSHKAVEIGREYVAKSGNERRSYNDELASWIANAEISEIGRLANEGKVEEAEAKLSSLADGYNAACAFAVAATAIANSSTSCSISESARKTFEVTCRRRAFELLQVVVDAGQQRRAWLESYPDLQSVRDDIQFQELVSHVSQIDRDLRTGPEHRTL